MAATIAAFMQAHGTTTVKTHRQAETVEKEPLRLVELKRVMPSCIMKAGPQATAWGKIPSNKEPEI